MINETIVENSMTEVFEAAEAVETIDMSVPLQTLFDDVITFISKTDFV